MLSILGGCRSFKFSSLCLWDPVNPASSYTAYAVNERSSSNGCTPFLRRPIRRDLPTPILDYSLDHALDMILLILVD